MEFKQNLKMYQDIVNNELEKYLRKEECPEKTLNNSMEYSLMAGGKRLRPILVLATYQLFKEDIEEDNKNVILKFIGKNKPIKCLKKIIKKQFHMQLQLK